MPCRQFAAAPQPLHQQQAASIARRQQHHQPRHHRQHQRQHLRGRVVAAGVVEQGADPQRLALGGFTQALFTITLLCRQSGCCRLQSCWIVDMHQRLPGSRLLLRQRSQIHRTVDLLLERIGTLQRQHAHHGRGRAINADQPTDD